MRELIMDALKPIVGDVSKYCIHTLWSGGATEATRAGIADRLHGRWISESAKERKSSLIIVIVYYWNKVTVHHLKLCYFLMKKDNTMICGVLLNHCLTVNRIISKSVFLDTRLRDTSLKISSSLSSLHQRQWWTHTILSLWTDFWHHISSRTCHEA